MLTLLCFLVLFSLFSVCSGPTTVYSFSYHTMYIDLLRWQVVKIPGVRPIDLEGYWGRKPLCIPLYYLTEGSTQHTEKTKQYLMSLEIDRVWDVPVGETGVHPGIPSHWPLVPAATGALEVHTGHTEPVLEDEKGEEVDQLSKEIAVMYHNILKSCKEEEGE